MKIYGNYHIPGEVVFILVSILAAIAFILVMKLTGQQITFIPSQ